MSLKKSYTSTFGKSLYIKTLSAEVEIYYRVICKPTTFHDNTTYGILPYTRTQLL